MRTEVQMAPDRMYGIVNSLGKRLSATSGDKTTYPPIPLELRAEARQMLTDLIAPNPTKTLMTVVPRSVQKMVRRRNLGS